MQITLNFNLIYTYYKHGMLTLNFNPINLFKYVQVSDVNKLFEEMGRS